ncbi:MAG TPA: gluconate 2-dehydrogenase subunit 3 family protein [Bryobacteraceae bacterium]|nr:gluconate 2-dehydrogenase subunit 3 family protein [Bryobacteraceae bacterium]
MSRSRPGYYPGFHTLDQRKFWDARTREVILDRVTNVPPIRFFTEEQARLMEAICHHILPQDDHDEQHRIPILPWIDQRLYDDSHDGYRYEDMPPDREAYRLALQAIEEISRKLHGRAFTEIGDREQDELLQTIHDGNPPAAHEIWSRMPVERFWMLLVQDCVTAYYSHPFAWDEIGFGGPAYPRAYMRLERGEAEPWEVEEQRYEWTAPESSVSDKFTPVGGKEEHHGGPQGGTH